MSTIIVNLVGSVNYKTRNVEGIAFDDIIIGPNGRKAEYTHWSADLPDDPAEPMFLCYDHEGKVLPLYMIGIRSLKKYLTERIPNKR